MAELQIEHLTLRFGGLTVLDDVSFAVNAGELFALPVCQPILENAEAHLITRAGRKLSFAANKMQNYMASGMASLR